MAQIQKSFSVKEPPSLLDEKCDNIVSDEKTLALSGAVSKILDPPSIQKDDHSNALKNVYPVYDLKLVDEPRPLARYIIIYVGV